VEHLSLPYEPATRRLFGVPVVTTNAATAGAGHTIATDAVALDTDTRGVDVQWSQNATADSFGKNLIFPRRPRAAKPSPIDTCVRAVFCTTFTFAPALIANDAHAWRRSCSRTPSIPPTAFTALANE
jgi:hypothetical protein